MVSASQLATDSKCDDSSRPLVALDLAGYPYAAVRVLFVFAYRRPVYFASVLVVRKSVTLMERDRIGAASMHTSLGNGGGSGLSVLSSSDDRGSHIIHPKPPTDVGKRAFTRRCALSRGTNDRAGQVVSR